MPCGELECAARAMGFGYVRAASEDAYADALTCPEIEGFIQTMIDECQRIR